jgi:hypothetical protein
VQRAKNRGKFSEVHPSDEHWSLAKERIGRELRKYYQACTTGELPPQLVALSEKLDQALSNKAVSNSAFG